MPLNGRLITAGAVLVTAGLIGALIYYGTQPDYGVLFSDLKPADAQSVVEKLRAANVPYSLANNGTTVQVPLDRIPELRLQMASEGAISGGHVGFDLFDKTSFGATDFAQQVNYRRAIEGELSRTLEAMNEVESARVHITPRKDSVFTEKEEGAKAAVTLRVRQDKQLTNERTDAIVSLVASAVEGLDPANVAVLDTRGRLLTKGNQGKNGSMSDAGAFNEQLEAKLAFESESSARVVALLEPVLGEGRVRTDVSADINFNKVEQTEEKYNPQSQVIRSQQTSQESRSSSAGTPGGVVGARANDPTNPTPPPAAANPAASGDQRTSSTTNYEIDKTVRRTVGAGGQINRLTVSVVVDSKNVEGVEVVRQPDELQKIQEIVSAAVGANPERGDSVVVQTMTFDKPKVEEPGTASSFLESNRQLINTVIKWAALVIVALLVLFLIIRPAKRALRLAAASGGEPMMLPPGDATGERRQSEPAQQLPEAQPPTVAEMEAKMLADLEASKPKLTPEEQRSLTVRKVISDETIHNPESVAGTLRSWLQEG